MNKICVWGALVIATLCICSGCSKFDRLPGINIRSKNVENGLYINGEKVYDLQTLLTRSVEDYHSNQYYINCRFYEIDYMRSEYYDNNIFPKGRALCKIISKHTLLDENGKKLDFDSDFDIFSISYQDKTGSYVAYADNDSQRIAASNAAHYHSEECEIKTYSWYTRGPEWFTSEWFDIRIRILLKESGTVVDIVYRGAPYNNPNYHPIG